MTLDEIKNLDKHYYVPCFGNRTDFLATRGEGVYLYNENDEAYLDMIAGIAVNILGYGNAYVTEQISQQVQTLIHCSNLYYNAPQSLLAKALCQLTTYEKAFFCNSGAEANEAAIKLARAYFSHKGENRYEIISAVRSFHGRTLATLTATGQEKFHKGFAPLPQGFKSVPFNDVEALKAAITAHTAAILLEPIQGESGVYPLEQEAVDGIVRLCKEEGILLIFDEIQSGMWRSGHFMAQESYGHKADITTLAKGLGGGVPIGALLTSTEIAEAFTAGSHGTTFGGNPLASTAALAVLKEGERLQLAENAQKTGGQIVRGLQAFQEQGLGITQIRGKGLMLAFDLKEDKAKALREALFDRQILVNSCTDRSIRLLPPLTLAPHEATQFLCAVEESLKALF